MKLNPNDIEWNDALGDLYFLGDVERNLIVCLVNKNIVGAIDWTEAYLLKLAAICGFDVDKFIKRIDEVREKYYSIKNNSDGSLESWEIFNNNENYSTANKEIKKIYYDLARIKVENDLSVRVKTQKEKELRKKYAVANI